MRKILLGAALAAVLGACGGGSGGGSGGFKDPDSVAFTYGAPQTASGAALSAASAGDSGAASALAVQGEANDDLASAQSQNVANLPNDMAGVFTGSSMIPLSRGLEQAQGQVLRRATAYLAGDVASAAPGWDNETCWSVTGTANSSGVAGQIKFDHCTLTEIDTTAGTTASFNIDGTFNRVNGRVYWDATASITFSGPVQGGTATVHASDHLSGDISTDTTAHTVIGGARSDIAIAFAAPGLSVSGKVTYDADVNVLYTPGTTPCVSDGTLTLKRVWTERPSHPDIDPADVTDQAVKFTWGGTCGVVNVQYSL